MNKTLLLAGAACFLAFNANAVEVKPYVGLDYNYSITNTDNDHGWANNFNSGSIVAGTKITPYAGVEAFWQLGYKATDRLEGTKTTSYFDAVGIDALGYLPLGCSNFELIGSAGIANYKFKDKAVGEGTHKDYGIGYRLGAGAQYNVSENIGVRAMYRHAFIDNATTNDINEYSLGVRYSF